MASKTITKSMIITEISNGGTSKEIAARLGISTTVLRDGIKKFNEGLEKSKQINLRSKPKNNINFVDDTEDLDTENSNTRTTTLLA